MKEILYGIFKNFIKMLLLLLAVSAVTFALVSLSPVDPLQANVGQAALGTMSEGQREKLEEYWGVNGEVDAVAFRFPSPRTGEILVETKAPLCEEAMEVCGSFFHYSLETGIGSDLRRDGYVKTPQNLPAVNTRDRTYFSLAAEPKSPDTDFERAVESLSQEQSGPSL